VLKSEQAGCLESEREVGFWEVGEDSYWVGVDGGIHTTHVITDAICCARPRHSSRVVQQKPVHGI
jgi:hypothetical protein